MESRTDPMGQRSGQDALYLQNVTSLVNPFSRRWRGMDWDANRLRGGPVKGADAVRRDEFASPCDCPSRERGEARRLSKELLYFLRHRGRDPHCVAPGRADDDSGLRRHDLSRAAEVQAD